MALRILVFLCLNIHLGSATFYKSEPSDLSLCDVHYSRTGSAYKDFYSVENLYKNPQNDSYLLDLHFGVMASSDAHILLAPSAQVTKLDPVYELVIGAGGNTFCDIRRMQKSEVKSSVRIAGLLSGLDPHFFWIHIAKDGLIAVGREGNTTSFISWKDDDPLPIKEFSFSTWSDIEAKWYYNCDRSKDHEELEKKLTPLEKLRRDLLNTYDPMVRPVVDENIVTIVSMSINMGHLQLNEHRSTMDISGTAKLLWHDEKMIWDPENYNGLKQFHVFRKEIWHPDLICFNAAGDLRNIAEDSMLVVSNTGLVSWNPILKLSVWCDSADLSLWPRDQHTCSLVLGFFRDYGRVLLELDTDNSSLISRENSEWVVLDVGLVEQQEINNGTLAGPPAFELNFVMKRSSTVYSTIFFTPFLVVAVCLLLSFWVSPFGHLKISMSCVAMLLETTMLLAMATFVPNSSKGVPFLLELYSYSLIGSLISLLISIIVINFSRNRPPSALPHLFCNFLTSKCMKTVLFLPNVVMPDEYGELTNQIFKVEDKDQSMWILLGIVIDRLAFYVFLPLVLFCIGNFAATCF